MNGWMGGCQGACRMRSRVGRCDRSTRYYARRGLGGGINQSSIMPPHIPTRIPHTHATCRLLLLLLLLVFLLLLLTNAETTTRALCLLSRVPGRMRFGGLPIVIGRTSKWAKSWKAPPSDDEKLFTITAFSISYCDRLDDRFSRRQPAAHHHHPVLIDISAAVSRVSCALFSSTQALAQKAKHHFFCSR